MHRLVVAIPLVVALGCTSESGDQRGFDAAFSCDGLADRWAALQQTALDETVSELKNAGAEVAGTICDVTEQASVDALAKAALDAFGAVHVLCNNAGVAGAGTGQSWERPIEDWNWVMATLK